MSLTKRLLKNMSIFTGVQSSGILCSIIRAKLIAIWIGPVGVGLNALLTNAFSLLSQLSQLGINVSSVRDIAAAKGTEQRLVIRAVLRWSLILGLIGGGLTLLLSPLLSLLTFGDFSHSWMFVIMSVAVLAAVVTAGRQAVLQGTERLRQLARLILKGVILSTAIAIPLFWWLRLNSIPWVVLTFALVPALFYWFDRDINNLGRPIEGLEDRRVNTSFIRFGIGLTLANMLSMAGGYILSVFLNRYASMAEVGIYQAGYSIIGNYMGILITAMSVGYYPLLSSQVSHPDRCSIIISRQLWLLTCMILIMVPAFLLCRKLIVWLLYSPDFYTIIPYITLAVGGGALRLISTAMATMIIVRGDLRTYMATETISEFIGIALNIIGYIHSGVAGMGIAYTIWYLLYTIAIWLILHYRYHLRINRRVSVMICVTTVAIALLISATIILD